MQGVEKVIPVENGVIVVATNTWLAFEAAKAVDCEWGPLRILLRPKATSIS